MFMRLRSLREKPKADKAPKIGKGVGTDSISSNLTLFQVKLNMPSLLKSILPVQEAQAKVPVPLIAESRKSTTFGVDELENPVKSPESCMDLTVSVPAPAPNPLTR